MPAPKGGADSHDAQPQMKKLDEDGEALPSKTAPAPHNSSLKAEEKTEAHRTKIKRSASAERGIIPAKSSKQSSPSEDSSKTISDPPVKKAKLLKATSASCGDAPSEKEISKASLKRTASTDSEDEFSGDGSKTGFFRERDEGDKARCIRKYSNRVKAKRKAEEPLSDPQDTSQESPTEPPGTIQMDHNYGRFSDSSSSQSLGETFHEEKKEFVTESEGQESVVHATQAESKDTVVFAAESKHEEIQTLKSQRLTDNEAPASSREIFDCYTAKVPDTPGVTSEAGESEKKDIEDYTKSQKGTVGVTHASPVEKLYCSTGEENLSAGVEVLSHETSNGRIPERQTEDNPMTTTESVGNPMTQTDLSFKIQVTFKAESKSEHLDAVSNQVPDTNMNSCDVNKVRKSEEKVEGSERKDVKFLASQTVDGPPPLIDQQLSPEVIEKTTKSCTETLKSDCKAVQEQNQRDVLAGCVTASEGQIDVDTKTKITSEEKSDSAQRHKNHRLTTTEIPVEVRENSLSMEEEKKIPQYLNVRKDTQASETYQQQKLSIQAATVEIQSQRSQDVFEQGTDISTKFSQDYVVNSKRTENEDKVGIEPATGLESQIRTETQMTPTSESSNQTPAGEVNNQGVSECTADILIQGQQDVVIENSEMFENKDMGNDDSTSGPEDVTAVTPVVYTMEVPSWECSEVSEKTSDMSDKIQRLPVANCQDTEDDGSIHAECVNAAADIQINMGRQTTATLSEVSDAAPTIEAEVQKSQKATKPPADISENVHEGFTVQTPETENESRINTGGGIATKNQREMDLQTTTTPGEFSDQAVTVENQQKSGQDVSEPTTDIEVQRDFINAETENEERKGNVITESGDSAENQTEMDSQAATEEIIIPISPVEIQSQEVNELNTKYIVTSGFENSKVTSKSDVAPDVLIDMETPVTAVANGIPNPLPLVDAGNTENQNMQPNSRVENMQANLDLIGGLIGSADSTLPEETGRQLINEVKDEDAIVCSDKDEKAVRNNEGHVEGTGSHEVLVFVCDQPDDTNVVIQAPEEIKTHNRPEIEIHENQVVYEPISSPESNDEREIPAASENHNGMSLLDVQITETQQIEGDSSAKEENREICNQQLDAAEQQICASDSQEVEMEVQTISVPESCVSAQFEQGETSVDGKQVAVISSSDDISTPDGQSEVAAKKSERNGYPHCIGGAEVSEQVQEDAGLEGVSDVTVTTTTATTEVEIPDSTSQEFVMLEPVHESEIHFDIVTQAAAVSGLSVSLTEQVNPDSAFLSDEGKHKVLNGSELAISISEAEVSHCQTTGELEYPTVSNSHEVLDLETKQGVEISSEIGVEVIQNNDQSQQPSSDMMDVNIPEIETTNSQVINEDSNALVSEHPESNVILQEVQLLEDIEIAHEIVVAEDDNEEDSDILIIEKPQETPDIIPDKISEIKVETKKDKNRATNLKQNSTSVEKPKKQEMNTQARTKARLAALAEQKAAAAKKPANRQQMNLLALCQEIAEDIATDSMLLKRIEEEKQAAAAVAAAASAAALALAAAKSEATKKESQPENTQEVETVNVATPAGPEGCSAPVTPATKEESVAQVSPAVSAEAKPAAETPKRRFFITQVSVPLKAHEKKKLTRYQRLRQVELQREKMSWARVKKLKSDQANQMFSDMDWQGPMSSFSVTPVTLASQPPASPSKTSLPSPSSASKPATPKAEVSEVDSPKVEPSKAEPTKTEPPKSDPTNAQPAKTEPTKPEVATTQASKNGTPVAETRKSTRLSKVQASKVTTTPGPAPKVTRSPAKRTLPAVPPPMPNGLKAQKQKPVEYIPYKPRPKYTFEDFELDDDPLPTAPKRPITQTRPTQPTRPNVQSNPTAQAKPTVSSQLANQAKLKAQTTPTGQISGQSKPSCSPSPQSKAAVTTTPQSKAPTTKSAPSAQAQLKSPALTTTHPKAASAPGQSKPAASASLQLKPTGDGVPSQIKQSTSTSRPPAGSTTSETKPAAAASKAAPQPPNPTSSDDSKCNETADLPSSANISVAADVNSKGSDVKCEEKLAGAAGDPPPEVKTETDKTSEPSQGAVKPKEGETPLSDASLQKEVKKLKEADKDGTQTIIDAGQKHFGAVACSVCGMLYSAANPEDESQHLLFHNQFISAVRYVGWKKERILAEFPDGKIILVLPDDPKYALKKVEEIREMVDNDLGFQQVETKCPSKTKTFLFISNDKKVGGCLIAEHIQEGYRVIEEPAPQGSEGEKVMFERQRAWCCSTTAEPAICGISRIWVVSMMRRQSIASRMLECLRNNFIYGSYLSKDEIAFSDPTPDGKLFATHYFGTSQFLVYNFVSGTPMSQPKTDAV
ncbi:microtubule-associated protein futsch-like isoform X2 [Notolabrus celidotus]|uniref:microtubule-associated protein futsch-like isoform X2 n=1 Tax=Notolabrus celidotus TaxID=1203425 RepID=UPI00148F7435|nr:microtubule-associated protein futsch-like isoform X2 [Notolabrus celidotus]